MSTERVTRVAALGCALSLAAACDGFGKPIVGGYPEGRERASLCIDVAAPCTPIPAFQKLAARPAPSFVLSACGDQGRACPESGPPQTQSGCELAWQLDAGVNDRFTSLSCTHVALGVAAGVTTARVENLSLVQTELEISASSPVTIEFAHAVLRATRVTLRGPITLRFSEESDLSDTQLSDQSPSGASLELSASRTSEFAAIDLRGTASVERSTLSDTQLFARQVHLQNCVVQNLSVSTDQLFAAVELKGAELALEVGEGVLAAAEVDHIKLQRCDTLLITNSQSYMSVLGACTQRLRVDRSSIGKSIAVGPIESHITIWDGMTFGPGAPVALESWKDSLSNSRLCPTLSRLSLSEPTVLTCNACDLLGAAADTLLCSVPSLSETPMSPEVVVEHNPLCPSLASLATCNPLPTDENPF